MKSCIVLFKLCKENYRVQSKILDVSFSIEFRFETKIGCFVTRLCAFAHSYSYKFSQITMAPDLLRKEPHIHISSVIFVLSIMLINVFICPYSFVNITVIPVHSYYFIFCFKLYFPIVISSSITFIYYFSVRIKPIQNPVTKTKKTHRDIILA